MGVVERTAWPFHAIHTPEKRQSASHAARKGQCHGPGVGAAEQAAGGPVDRPADRWTLCQIGKRWDGNAGNGYGSKLNLRGTAGFSHWFHLPGVHFGHLFLTYSQMSAPLPQVVGLFKHQIAQ